MYQWVSDPVIARALGLRREPTLDYTTQWIQRSLDDPLMSAYAMLVKQSHVGNVEAAVVRRTVGARQTGPVHCEDDRQVLEGDLLEDLVV